MKYFVYAYKNASNLGKLYFLPKIYKRLSNVPGRPVISNCGTPTEKASEFRDYPVKPVMQRSWSYIKDSGDFVERIKRISNIPDDAILVTADVEGLYPSIPHELGLKVLEEALEKRDSIQISTSGLVKMAKFVLQNNYFGFNGDTKQQISGATIGTKFAPPYACMFMDQVELEFLKTQIHQPLVWFRFIDDIFFIWTHGEDKLEQFLVDFNKFHPSLKFTHEPSSKNVKFLHVDVKFLNGPIITDLHIKATDRHQYLDYTSSHPHHTKRSIVYSQALRVSRVCSANEYFKRHRNQMKLWFLNRGYPKWLIDTEVEKVKFPCTSRKTETKMKGIPLVITYHPLIKDFASVIRKHLYILYLNKEVKEIFTPGPIIPSRGARKLTSYLVRAKLYPLERSVGSFKCNGKRCQVCLNVTETKIFSSTVTKKV